MHALRRFVRVLARAALCAAVLAAAGSAARAGDAPRAIPAIENDLVADDPAVRAKAAAELTDRFPDGAVAVPMLVDLLDDEDPSVVAAAARAIDVMAVAAVTDLAAFCNRELGRDPTTQFEQRLSNVRDPRTALELIDVHWLVNGRIPADMPTMAALVTRTPGSTPEFPLLLAVARLTTGDAHKWSLVALAIHGADALAAKGVAGAESPTRSEAMAAAIALIHSDDEMNTWAGCQILAALRTSNALAVEALTHVVVSRQADSPSGRLHLQSTRRAACLALGRIGPAASAAAPALLEDPRLWGSDMTDISEWTHVLLQMGREADVVARLPTTYDIIYEVATALALERRATTAAARVLVDAIQLDPKDRNVLTGVIALGPAASDAIHFLRRVCREAETPEWKLRFLEAVLAIDPNDTEGQKIAETAGRDPALSARVRAIVARHAAPSLSLAVRLGRSVTDAAAAESSTYDFPVEEIQGLLRCPQFAKGAVPGLVRILEIEDRRASDPALVTSPSNRRLTAGTLGRIGPDAAAAVPALTALRDKGDETIRVPAAQALRRIRAKK